MFRRSFLRQDDGLDCGGSTGGSYAPVTGQLGQITKKQMGYTMQVKQHDWMGQYAVWQAMQLNSSLDTSAVLHSFKTMATNSRFSLLSQIENKLAKGNKLGADSLLNAHPLDSLADTDTNTTTGVRVADDTAAAANVIVSNYRQFYRLYIKYEDSTLTGADSTAIETMATLCPLTNGAVVYKARALYDIVFDTLRIFESNCSGEIMAERMAHGGDSMDGPTFVPTAVGTMVGNAGQKYLLFPNPNDGNFILQQAVIDNEPVEVEIWDVVGRSIYKEHLQFAEATSSIKVKNTLQGLYLLQITDSKGRMFKFKFVVE